MQKSNLESKTNLKGVLVFVAGLCTYAAGTDFIQQFSGADGINWDIPAILLMVSGIADVIIRQFTDKPIRALFGWRK